MLTPEREKEIRQRIDAIKHYAKTSQLMGSYEETPGPDMEEMLAEIDSLREKLKVACKHWEMGIDIIYEDDPNEEEAEMERELLSKIQGETQPKREELKWKPY